MLRIIRSPALKVTTISLEGKLLRPWIDEVRNEIAAARLEGLVKLDLSHLSFADEPGLVLLRELQADGVDLALPSAVLAGLMQRTPIGNSSV